MARHFCPMSEKMSVKGNVIFVKYAKDQASFYDGTMDEERNEARENTKIII